MSYYFTFLIAIFQHISAAQTPLTNGSFEDGTKGLTLNNALASVSSERAAAGKQSLKVADEDEGRGCDVLMARVPITAGAYTLSGQVFPVAGMGLGVYLRVYDGEQGGAVRDTFTRTLPSAPAGQWVPWQITGLVAAPRAFAEVWIHSYNAAKVTAYVDDLALTRAPLTPARPPWPGTYKIKPNEKAKLTPADVVGPDGVVYPDWRYAGKPGGIPQLKATATIEQFGGRADDDLDDSAALQAGADAMGARGGGVLQLGAGTYSLDKPVIVTRDNVVIRGAGAGRTKLIFRYQVPDGSATFLYPRPGATIDANTWSEAHADPHLLNYLEIQVDGKTIAKRDKGFYEDATYDIGALGSDALSKVADKDAPHVFKIIARYSDGRSVERAATFRTTSAPPHEPPRVPHQLAAITFAGVSRYGASLLLARDGQRGEKTLLLQSVAGLKVGSRIQLRAPATPRWNALVKNAAPWGDYRRYEFLVTAIQGNEITLNQPLRLDYPVIDGAYVAPIFPIRNCGLEDLSLEQTHKLWTSGIVFSEAWECWARGVTVKKAGRFPLYAIRAKWLEFRDVTIDDAWIKGGGGTGYVGWEYAYDCLLDGVTTYKVRHAPLVQWSAAGNVVRRGTFHASDAQWHAGWANENLFEQCVIQSEVGNGGYGYGMFGTAPEDAEHGPIGPRNVVYNCDVSSPKSGVSMGGMNEGWLFLHNRFVVGSGPGVEAKTASFDHTFWDNVFVLQDSAQPAFLLRTPDCVGWELRDNTILGGNGQLSGGLGAPLIAQNNALRPLGASARPQPKVPSIFEWEKGH